MTTFTFYKDNRIDGAFEVSEKELRDKFVEWFSNEPDRKLMFEDYPKECIIQRFLLVAGSYSTQDYQEITRSLRGVCIQK